MRGVLIGYVIARSVATKQSNQNRFKPLIVLVGLLRFARNDAKRFLSLKMLFPKGTFQLKKTAIKAVFFM